MTEAGSGEEARCPVHKVPLVQDEPGGQVRLVTAGTAGLGGGGSRSQGEPYCPACDSEHEHLYALFCGTKEGLGFCGCGMPEEVYGLIRDILSLAPFFEGYQTGEPNHEKVKALLGGSDAVFYGFLYWIDKSGLIEHGGGIGGSWLTEKGTHYLELMRRHEWDDLEEAGFPHDGDECPVTCPHWIASHSEWQRDAIIKERAQKPPDPQEPIPSDDKRCRCSRTPQSGWEFRKITGTVAHRDAKQDFGGPATLWISLGCPHHGNIARQMDRVRV